MSDALSSIVHQLYDAALSPEGWTGALQALAGALEADNTHLMVWSPMQPQPYLSLTWGMDEAVEARYQAHYGSIDPRRLIVADMDEGQWFSCQHRFDERSVNRSEFWQDYLIPGGCRWLLGTRLTQYDGQDVFFGMHRAPDRQPFSDSELNFMRQLTGHFQRAAQTWLRFEALREQAAIGTHALDVVEQGVVALDDSARVVYANRFAEAMLRTGDPLRLQCGVLTAKQHRDAQRLRNAISFCLSSQRPVSLQIGLAFVTVLRRPLEEVWSDGRGSTTMLALVSHQHHRRMPSAGQLIQWFALTPAEARIARALAAGQTLEGYAQDSSLSMATVKTQLSAVLRKTGTTRQATLLRLMGTLPVVRHSNG